MSAVMGLDEIIIDTKQALSTLITRYFEGKLLGRRKMLKG